MPYLSVNIDYVAVIRQSRQTDEPDPVVAAGLVELAGAQGITAHLREDRRHIVDRDVRLLREVVRLPFNLEMAVTDEMVRFATELLPDLSTIVPERRQEITTEGGLDVIAHRDTLAQAVEALKNKGIETSIFIDPVRGQIDAARDLGADCVELHTGEYANARTRAASRERLSQLAEAARYARDCGLDVHAGHGLTYRNVRPVAEIPEVGGLYIGHSIMSRAVYVGLEKAVQDMIHLIQNTQRG